MDTSKAYSKICERKEVKSAIKVDTFRVLDLLKLGIGCATIAKGEGVTGSAISRWKQRFRKQGLLDGINDTAGGHWPRVEVSTRNCYNCTHIGFYSGMRVCCRLGRNLGRRMPTLSFKYLKHKGAWLAPGCIDCKGFYNDWR